METTLSKTRIQEYLERQALIRPHKTAIRFKNESLSFSQLDQKANQLARYLLCLDVQAGDFIPIYSDKSLFCIIAMFGILKAGAVFIPIGAETSPKSMLAILTHAKVGLMFASINVREQIPEALVNIITLEHLEDMTKTQSTDAIDLNPDTELAYVIYTSGTTGLPKGVMIRHSNLVATYHSWARIFSLTPSDVHLQMAHFAFDVFVGDMVRALCSGAELVLCDKNTLLKPDALFKLIKVHKVTCAEFVPSVLRALIGYLQQSQQALEGFRLLICGSDIWTMAEYRQVKSLCSPNTRLMSTYGLTEATIDSTWYEEKGAYLEPQSLVPLGYPFPHVDMYVLNEQLETSALNQLGELYIGGAGVAKGYLNQPTLTEERFIKSPFKKDEWLYKTGDYGMKTSDGCILFYGRNQTHVKIQGQRVELLALENIVNQQPKVECCIAFSQMNSRGEPAVELGLLLRDQTLRYEELIAFIKTHLPNYYIPSKIQRLERLVFLPNGKVSRSYDAQKWLAPLERSITRPTNQLEATLIDIWKSILGIEACGITCDFYDLGGTSLQFMNMLEQLQQRLNVHVEFSKTPSTISAIAHLLRELESI